MCLSSAVAVGTPTQDATQFPEGHAPASRSQAPLLVLTLVRAPGPAGAPRGAAEPVSGVQEVLGEQLQQ